MESDPFKVVRVFEYELCEYAGSKYAVAVTSCTSALLLAVSWFLRDDPRPWPPLLKQAIEIPKRTYVGVGMSILNAGGRVTFRDMDWSGEYWLNPAPIIDSARRFTSNMHYPNTFRCLSFHHTKTLAISTHGGAILHDDPEADVYFRRARFDGRRERTAPKDDVFDVRGFHCYMVPSVAAEGLLRLATLPRVNADLPTSDYSDLSLAPVFK